MSDRNVVGYRVDLVCGAELLAWSPVIFEPPWSRVDDALVEADLLAELLLRRGHQADVRLSVVELSSDSGKLATVPRGT
jgi:hypothetical protein